jgi:hypothetical protein
LLNVFDNFIDTEFTISVELTPSVFKPSAVVIVDVINIPL